MGQTFEWDEGKDLSNQKKHRVSFEEAKTVFNDPRSITIADENIPMRKIDTSTSASPLAVV